MCDLLDKAQVSISRSREQRGIPQPQADYEYERANQGDGLEDTAAGPNRSLLCFVVHGRVNDSIDRLSHPGRPSPQGAAVLIRPRSRHRVSAAKPRDRAAQQKPDCPIGDPSNIELSGWSGQNGRQPPKRDNPMMAMLASGQVEGQITRLKLIKRQTYGRTKLDLLRARLREAA